mgnify:CR=1 FL=1
MALSVCLIVKNEEEVIARCLNCVKKFADEIVAVDTGSTDKTVEIIKTFTDKVYHFKWCNDFSAARNFAFGKAHGDYLMWLDADDVISDENCGKIKSLLSGADFDMAFLPYATAFDGDSPTFVYYRERIIKNGRGYSFAGAVHEAIAPYGKIVYGDARIDHKKVKEGVPFRNLNIYQNQIAHGISLDERSKFYYGRELFYNKMYLESIAVLEEFLRGNGWVENKIEACLNLYYAYTAVNRAENAYSSLLKAFLYAPPRSEACCILGEKFMSENDFNSAIYWYQSALNAENGEASGAFVNRDFCGFIPCMQLCVLYDKLGDYKRAYVYNMSAGKFKPQNLNYLNNKKYFEEIRGVLPNEQ